MKSQEEQFKEIKGKQQLLDAVLKVIALLKGEGVNNYPIVLFLIYIKRDGFLENVKNELILEDFFQLPMYTYENVDKFLREFIKKTDSDHKDFYLHFLDSFNNITAKTFDKIANKINTINTDLLKLYYGDVFEDIIYKFSSSLGWHGGEFIQPIELTKLICDLSSVKKEAAVYNPFGGLASFAVYLGKNVSYLGQEIEKNTWALGMLRLHVHGLQNTALIKLEDSVGHWNPQSTKFDLIVANPPINLKIENYTSKKKKPKVPLHLDTFFLLGSLDDLNPEGKVIVIMPDNTLYGSRRDQEIVRKMVITDDVLESIISFPAGVLTNTSLPFSVWIINKAKRQKSNVLLVDATKYISDIGHKKLVKNEELFKAILNRDESCTKLISNKQIADNKHNFSIQRYFIEDIPGVRLESLLKVIPGEMVKRNTIQKIVRTSDLKNKFDDFFIDIDKIDTQLITKYSGVYKIEKPALLIATIGNDLKPTFFEYKKGNLPLLISSNIVAFEVDENKVDVSYLIKELKSDYVRNQVDYFRTGATIPRLRRNDLLKIKVDLPSSIVEQRARLIGARESIKMINDFISSELSYLDKELKEEESKISLEELGEIHDDIGKYVKWAEGKYKETMYIDVLNNIIENIKQRKTEEINLGSLRHSLGKMLSNINTGLEIIELTLSKHAKTWKEIKIDTSEKETIGDKLSYIYDNLDQIHTHITINEHDLNFPKYPIKEINIIKFVSDYFTSINLSGNKKYEKTLDISPDIKHAYNNLIYINANEELLKIVFNNIIDNSDRHAFVKPYKNYKIELRVGLSIRNKQNFVRIEFSNNGKPFPQGFSKRDYTTMYKKADNTGNTGIGGHDISEITKQLKGELNLQLEYDQISEYCTTIELIFPIESKIE